MLSSISREIGSSVYVKIKIPEKSVYFLTTGSDGRELKIYGAKNAIAAIESSKFHFM